MDLGDELIAVLGECGLACEMDDAGILTSAPIAGESGGAPPFRVFLAVDGGVVKALAAPAQMPSGAPPWRVPLAARAATARALAALNSELPEGTAEIDVRDGELRYRVSYPVVPEMDIAPLARQATRLCLSHFPSLTVAVAAVVDAAARAPRSGVPDIELSGLAKSCIADAAERLAAAV